MIIDPKEIPIPQLHGYLLGTVGPRPIAFASTIDKNGNVNLSPFSFFNVFSANPPVLIFSPARKGKDNTEKHSYQNVLEHPETTINVVSYDMVQQMSLASTEYEKGVNEFIKSGFTEEPSDLIKPPRVKEAKASFECKVLEVKALGSEGGAGNLVICEVLRIHVEESVLDEDGKIDPFRMDLVGRMGGDWYVRAQGEALFEVAKPLKNKGVGVDQIPSSILNSKALTNNHFGQLGNVEQLPSPEEVEWQSQQPEVSSILDALKSTPDQLQLELHKLAAKHLDQGDVVGAWKVLLVSDYFLKSR